MPYESLAQEGYLHSHPEILGDKMKEWDSATKGRSLPNYSQSHAARKEESQ